MFEDFPSDFWPAMQYELWRYREGDPLAVAYHWLNICEAIVWFIIAGIVARRLFQEHRAPLWEVYYLGLFVVFGVSDLWEAQVIPVWLIVAKGIIFLNIVGVRRVLIRRFYPEARF
ncbi:MAG: hypothetical protein AAGA25_01325 [Planctomycetota bacterium]